jgi:hypothetical protein
MMFGIQKYLINGVLLLAIGGGGYYYVKNLTTKVSLLESQKAVLSASNQSLSQTLEQTRESARLQAERISNLQDRLTSAETQSNELKRILLDHDLTDLALRKPGLIEERVNDGTQSVFRNIESDTAN